MLERLKTKLWEDLVVPNIVRRGWRPSKCMPIDFASLGFSSFGYDEEEEIKEAVAKVKNNTMTSFERLASLWQQVRYLDRYNIQGSFVECGVWKGGSVGMMALAHLKSSPTPNRMLHLFDSFEGLPEPDSDVDGDKAISYAGNRADGHLSTIGKCVGSLEENKALLEGRIRYPSSLVNYHVGWFEKTVPVESSTFGQIALLRLDGDWYESTKVCLSHLYPKVVPGGVVVIDDYGHWEGCRRAVDEFIQNSQEPILLNHVDYTGRYWIKR